MQHDDTRDAAGVLAALALTPGKISYAPIINYDRDRSAEMPNTPRATVNRAGEEARADVLLHEPWEHGMGCILNTRVADTDAKSYGNFCSTKVLEKAARQKVGRYLGACLARRRPFMPLVYLVDSMGCEEAKAFEKHIASPLATKWDIPYSEMVGCVRGRMGIATTMHNTMLLRGSGFKYREVL